VFLAKPWWVNLLALVPIASYIFLRIRKLSLDSITLVAGATFGIAFGFVEATVVVYLRSASGLLPGAFDTVSQAMSQAVGALPAAQVLGSLPDSLVAVETLREAATMVMLVSVAVLGARNAAGRFALFLWAFATWDLAYYAGLWLVIRWPPSLGEFDVLFLIPQPWISQVWFPLAVSSLTLAAVMLARKSLPEKF
jgi:hypothetical protein